MRSPVVIGLIIPAGLNYCRGVLRGIRHHAEREPDWVFAQADSTPEAVTAVRRHRPAGLIAYVSSRRVAAAVRRFPGPVVNVCGALAQLPFATVGTDNEAVGALAAEHFLGRGLKHFGYLGHGGFAFSVRRQTGFRDRLGREGYEPHAFHVPAGADFRPIARPIGPATRLIDWLRRLPKPVGLFACHDIWGGCATELCRRAGIAIPDEVAVVGVDDDDLLCELSRPRLSSIRVPAERVGEEAARLLGKLLGGTRPPDRPLLLPPCGIAVRQSSDLLAVDDPTVRAVLRAIRELAGTPARVTDIVRGIELSRRSVERRFREVVGRGIAVELCRQRMDRAKDLLAATGLTVAEVAARVGYPSPQRFAVAFRRETGTTPTTYRENHARDARFRRSSDRPIPHPASSRA